MSGSTTPYPIGEVKTLEEALTKVQQYFDEMYQERIGGSLVGDVFQVGDDEILAVRLLSTGGLQKTDGQLGVLPDPVGAISVTANGVAVKVKPNDGLAKDATGLYVIASIYKGFRDGMFVTVKDSTNLYVSGGAMEINGISWGLASRATVAIGTVTPSTLYYLYASCINDVWTFTLSVTVPLFSDTLGAAYMTGDTTKRWLADVQINSASEIDSVSQPIGQIENFRRDASGDVYEVTTGTNWAVDGVPWTGAIVTVGSGKDYATPEYAITHTDPDDVLILVYDGTYTNQMNFSHPGRKIRIRGMGASYTDVVLPNMYFEGVDNDVIMEWVTPSGSYYILIGPDHDTIGGSFCLNKSKILPQTGVFALHPSESSTITLLFRNVEWDGSDTGWDMYSSGVYGATPISMEKVWHNSGDAYWSTYYVYGSFTADDTVHQSGGTAPVGYGPNYGAFRIAPSPSGILTIFDTDRKELAGASPAVILALLGLDTDLLTFSLPASTTISTYGASVIDDANATAAQATLGLTTVVSNSHVPATVSAPLSITGQALSLVNDAAATVTEIDTGALANSDTKVPTSKAVTTAIAAGGGGVDGTYLFEVNGDGDLQPVTTNSIDEYYELDTNKDIMPKLPVLYELDANDDIEPKAA